MAVKQVRFPLEPYLTNTRIRTVRAKLELLVLTESRLFTPLRFMFDNGSGVTTIPCPTAQEHRIILPNEESMREVSTRTSGGDIKQRIRVGSVTIRIPGLGDDTYPLPC